MKRKGWIRRNLFWAQDFLGNHSLVKSQYEDILDIMNHPETGKKKVEKYLSEILAYAPEHTQFYRPYHGQGLEGFPVINKGICLEYYQQITSDTIQSSKVHGMSTNGSTGVPFTIFQNHEKRCRVIGELKVFMKLCGIDSHEPILFFDALSAKGRKVSYRKNFLNNIWMYDVFQFRKEEIDNMIAYMKRHPAKMLLAYPSAMKCISNYALREGVEIPKTLETIITAGEALHQDVRDISKKAFGQQCRFLSRYSNQEMGILGQENQENGGYILNYGSYYFECLKMDRDEPTDEGEVGRIVITDLFNHSFPLIRYDTGDAGVMVRPDNDNQFPYYKIVYGKKNDILYDENKNPLIPDAIDELFFGVLSIDQWQIVQNDYGQFEMNLKGDQIDPKEIQQIVTKLSHACGGQVKVDVHIVDQIPDLGGGKNRFIICNIEKGKE